MTARKHCALPAAQWQGNILEQNHLHGTGKRVTQHSGVYRREEPSYRLNGQCTQLGRFWLCNLAEATKIRKRAC